MKHISSFFDPLRPVIFVVVFSLGILGLGIYCGIQSLLHPVVRAWRKMKGNGQFAKADISGSDKASTSREVTDEPLHTNAVQLLRQNKGRPKEYRNCGQSEAVVWFVPRCENPRWVIRSSWCMLASAPSAKSRRESDGEN